MSLEEDQKVPADETKITIQTQTILLHTTYGTIKKIPYIASMYERWTQNKSQPLFIDLPAKCVEKALNHVSTVDLEYFGIEKKEER
jgi:hypothetical protein